MDVWAYVIGALTLGAGAVLGSIATGIGVSAATHKRKGETDGDEQV